MRRNSLKYSIRLRDSRKKLSLNYFEPKTGDKCSIIITKIIEDSREYFKPDTKIYITVKNKDNNVIFYGEYSFYEPKEKDYINFFLELFHANGVALPNSIKETLLKNINKLRIKNL